MRGPLQTPALYGLADSEALAPRSLAYAVAVMAEEGIEWIQIRSKSLSDKQLCGELEECCRAVEGACAALWINDRADLATMFPVAGVHLGQRDLPPAEARKVVGVDVWIGQSTHSEVELLAADGDLQVDLIALGPIFETTGKRGADPVVGLEALRGLRGCTSKPLIAIGGVNVSTLGDVLAAGADGAAVLSGLCLGDVRQNCRGLMEVLAGR